MRDQQGLGAGLAGLDVQEVDALAVDLGGELWVPVELRLLCAPVVLRVPVPGEFPLASIACWNASSTTSTGQYPGSN